MPSRRAATISKSQVARDVAAQAGEFDDRIANQLAGAVIGDLAAAGDTIDRDVGGRIEDVAGIGGAPEGIGVRMFEEQQGVADRIAHAGGDERILQRDGGGVFDGAEARDGKRCGGVHDVRN
jgi:hypothetical protein